MSPTPVSFSPPTAPAGYSWEATSEEVAERYGVPVEAIVRFDLNTSPVPPELAADVLAGGRFDAGLSEYPPSDYRALAAAAAERYGVRPAELLVGAGADEILDLVGKAFVTPGGAAVVPVPTYAMYRVITEQRGATARIVERGPADDGWPLDVAATRAAAVGAEVVWLCAPNNPTGRSEPEGTIEALLAGLLEDASSAGRPAPIVVVDEAYAEFVGQAHDGLRAAYPRLISVRTASKAYALAGLRVGFAVAEPEIVEAIAPYRPPGSVSVVSVTVVRRAIEDGTAMAANVARVAAERARLTAALAEVGWTVGASVTNFILADFGTPERSAAVAEGLLRRGLVPRTFGAGHPLRARLRLTVRAADENDRLIAAASELAAEGIR
jgi:histidinol-phosphate aminotransferase